MDTFNIFLIFPNEKSIEDFISSEAYFSAYLSKIKDIVDRSDCEYGSSIFYDSSEVSRFINTLNTLGDLIFVEDYLIGDPSILIHELLRNSTDWAENPVHKAQYFLWDFGNPFAQQNMPPSVNEAVEYQIGDSNAVLLNLSFDFQKNKRFIFIIKDTSTHEDYMLPSFSQIEQIHDSNGLKNWLSINRTPRKLNIEDERHNEHSPKYVPEKSPLLYNFKRDTKGVSHVQNLLNEAIGDQYTDSNNKDLMNYDAQKERYIWFEYENARNQYHAYHLAKPRTHEADEKAVSRIPERTKRFIDKKP